MQSDNTEQTNLNAKKSFSLASALFPLEKWIPHGTGIFVAESRLSGGHKEQAKLYREISDVRILTGRGSIAYFLPERIDEWKTAKDDGLHSKHAIRSLTGLSLKLRLFRVTGQL